MNSLGQESDNAFFYQFVVADGIDDNIVKINLLDLLTQDKISSISIISTNEQKNNFPINSLIIISLLVILYFIIRKSK